MLHLFRRHRSSFSLGAYKTDNSCGLQNVQMCGSRVPSTHEHISSEQRNRDQFLTITPAMNLFPLGKERFHTFLGQLLDHPLLMPISCFDYVPARLRVSSESGLVSIQARGDIAPLSLSHWTSAHVFHSH